jgi:predicted permease
MATLLHDLRYGVRVLLKTPGFTAAAVLSLALGIGANTTIFTLINAVFLNPLPVKEPSRLVGLFTTDEKNTGAFQNFMPVSQPNYRDYQEHSRVFEGLVMHQNVPLNLASGGEPEQVFGEIVTGNYFDVLGIQPAIGRFFLAGEDKIPGAAPVVVMGHGLWQRRFGGDPSLVGKVITLNGQPFTVVGIAPEGFRGTDVVGGPQLWVPSMMHRQVLSGIFLDWYETRRALLFNIFGRLKPGVSIEQAAAELKTIAASLEARFPKDNDKRSVALLPLNDALINPNVQGQAVLAGWVLMAIVGLVLLIACANIANLQLARAAARRKEVAVRLSLGARRSRLIRQLLTESMLLAVTGGLLGLLIGVWGRDLLWSMRPAFIQDQTLALGLDIRVLAFTFALSMATGLVFGLVPALQASRPDLVVELKDKSSQPNRSNSVFTLRNSLVVAEVALSLVSLVGAGLFLRSLQNAQRIDPGFRTDNLAMLTFNVGAQGYGEQRARDYYRQVLERTEGVAGVSSQTLGQGVPLFGGGGARSVFPEGHEATPGRSGILVQLDIVGLKYFETLGMPLLRGRDFNADDRQNTPRVVVINQTMAKRFWPDEDALGKRFKFFGEEAWWEVVGIVRDAKYNTIGEEPIPYLYLPLEQNYSPIMTLIVRASTDAMTVLPTVRREVQQLDRQLPLTFVQTMDEVIRQSLFGPRMGAQLLGTFGALALLLAAIGIYGVMAYSVSQRTQEIGIRMALGARPADVQGLIVRQSMTIVAIGAILGILAAAAATRALSSLLFVGASDPVTFGITSALLASVALLASYIPARRATQVDPLTALRYE